MQPNSGQRRESLQGFGRPIKGPSGNSQVNAERIGNAAEIKTQRVDFLIRSGAPNHADSNLIYGANRSSIDKEDFQQLLALHLPANFISKPADDLLGRGIDHVP